MFGGRCVRLAWVLALALPAGGCSSNAPSEPAPQAKAAAVQQGSAKDCTADPVACDMQERPAPKVDAKRAFGYVEQMVALGPRIPGSKPHQQFGALLRKHLPIVEAQPFTARTPQGAVKMSNYIAKFPGTDERIVILASHYDTKTGIPNFAGANDGGSSSGLLLELGRQIQQSMAMGKRTGYTVWLVWFDGEEAYGDWSDTDSLYGSRHLAETMEKDGTLKKVRALFLMDMVGDADLKLETEAQSNDELNALVAQVGKRLGYGSFFSGRRMYIEDDHMPFVRKGVPAVDLIDFSYGYEHAHWHTAEDTLDKLSPRSLEVVGNIVLQSLWVLDARL